MLGVGVTAPSGAPWATRFPTVKVKRARQEETLRSLLISLVAKEAPPLALSRSGAFVVPSRCCWGSLHGREELNLCHARQLSGAAQSPEFTQAEPSHLAGA